jgi:ABC-type multidrug transport system ATPase subunit
MYAHLTVFETLMYSAHFYLPNEVTDEQKAELVTNVISELGLNKTRDTMIGDEKIRGVSGGERKRANIGVQLICDPAVLFLDEPTSGLDSFQAQAVMDSMRSIAHHGRLVITVIHQPRYAPLLLVHFELPSLARCSLSGNAAAFPGTILHGERVLHRTG